MKDYYEVEIAVDFDENLSLFEKVKEIIKDDFEFSPKSIFLLLYLQIKS